MKRPLIQDAPPPMPLRLGFLSTHPIQHTTPLFRALAALPDVDLRVYYCGQASPQEQSAAGFGVPFEWDISLLGGYDHVFLKNAASHPSTAGFWGLDVPEIASRIVADQLDAVVINGWHYKGAWQTMIACRRSRIPYLLRSDSHLGTERKLSTRFAKRLLYPLFIRRAGACLPAGRLASAYFQYYGASSEKTFIIPHCVDDARLTSEAARCVAERENTRRGWRVASDQIAWLFAGKFVEKKRPLDFVKTIEALHHVDGKSVGIMIGDGPLRAECQEYAVRAHAPIRFAGFMNQSEIARGYTAGDALVLPSDAGETWGLVVNEAMLCGLPCFVSDRVGCGQDLIEDGATGAIFPFGDPLASAKVLRRYSGPGMLAEMGSTARNRSHRFSAQTAADLLLQAARTTVTNARGTRGTLPPPGAEYSRSSTSDAQTPAPDCDRELAGQEQGEHV